MTFGLIFYHYERELSQAETNTISMARALSAALDQHVIGVQAAISTLAGSELLSERDLAAFDKRARTVKINGQLATVVLEDKSGHQLVNTALPFGSPLPSGASLEIIQAMKKGSAAVTGLFLGPVLQKKVVAVVVPVMRSNQIVYGLSAPIQPYQLRDILARQPLPLNWVAAVVDASGTVIARTHEHEKFVGLKTRPDLFERMQEVREDAVESITLAGIPVLSAFSRSPVSNWTVVVAMPRAELAGQLQNSLLLLLAGTLLILAASLSLAWFYAERISRTMHRLVEQSLALGRGEKASPARVDFREARQLGLAFQQAAEQFGQVHLALVQRNLDLQQFAFVASHDLRSPLRSVKGYLTLLEKRHAAALDDKGRELIQRASSAVEQMEELTDDLLSYASLDSPAKSPSAVDCNEVVASTLTFLHAAIAQTGAQIDVQALPTVSGDRGQLIQLFQNLLGNALKYCKDRSPEIQVSAQRRTAEWVFLVSDKGIGIESLHLQRIFEVFKRLHTLQEYPGNGIGLAICQRIVARHGGQIWACSEPGLGSTFFFSIPDQKVDAT